MMYVYTHHRTKTILKTLGKISDSVNFGPCICFGPSNFPGGAVVKNLPKKRKESVCHLPLQETQETWVQSLGWEDPLE